MAAFMAGGVFVVPVPSASPLLSTSLWEVPVPWTRVVDYGTVCQGPYPTTLTPRTVYRFSTCTVL